MAECDLTFSTFSAGQRAAGLGIRRGWHAKVSDQLINGKRFVGRTASAAATEPSLNTTKGHHSIIVDDCGNDCKVYGSTFSRETDGLIKQRALIEFTSTQVCTTAIQEEVFCSLNSLRVLVTPGEPIPPNNCDCPPHDVETNFYLTQREQPGTICFFEDSVGPFVGNLQILGGTPCRVRFAFITCNGCGGVHHGIDPNGMPLPDFDPDNPFPMTVPVFAFCWCGDVQTTMSVGGWRMVISEWP